MSKDQSRLLDRDAILGLLDRVADEAERREVSISLFLVGGGAMALAYSQNRATRDLDGVFEPKQVVYEIARVVAADVDMDLADDWLNDAAKSFMPGEDPNSTVAYERPGLSVRVASPRYLFAMKAMAAREVDEVDLLMLYRLSNFVDVGEALDVVERAYPHQPIKAAVQYLVEEIASEVSAERDGDSDTAVQIETDPSV